MNARSVASRPLCFNPFTKRLVIKPFLKKFMIITNRCAAWPRRHAVFDKTFSQKVFAQAVFWEGLLYISRDSNPGSSVGNARWWPLHYWCSLFFWCPDPDSNRGQLPLQGSALPLSYLGRQNYYLIMNSNLFFTFQKISGIFEWARWDSNSGPPPCQGDVITV